MEHRSKQGVPEKSEVEVKMNRQLLNLVQSQKWGISFVVDRGETNPGSFDVSMEFIENRDFVASPL